MATYLPDTLFAHEAPALDAGSAAVSPLATSGSPVTDDFSDLLEEPAPGRNPPYMDDFEDLVPEE
jgi:hypothetical protein